MTTTTKFTAVAYGMPCTISTSTNRESAIKNAIRKARKQMRDMKVDGQIPEIVCK